MFDDGVEEDVAILILVDVEIETALVAAIGRVGDFEETRQAPVAHRVARHLERQGLLERDTGHTYLTTDGVDEDPESPMNQLLGSSITYRISVGPQQAQDQTPAEKRASMTWAKRLKRVFDIDIETCSECGGDVRITVPAHPCAHGISASMHVIACIEDPEVIRKILAHLDEKVTPTGADLVPESRAPPATDLFA